ncbi:transcription antitermination factor NusB [Candidatus Parcubacteria bacterium]|nr:transcription antitermination factor NusB [Patescibacteria group bacterium]MBU4466648.1 transcription antitermination factor NusB [Patescibacteria group bacterium]MCG2688160.1 transcription antitermination factor NusB [Candidatus Parcubacteria bacterium]
MASRHLSRSIAMQSLFEWDFYGQESDSIDKIVDQNLKEFGPGLENHEFVWQLVKGVIDHLDQIDKIIVESAPEWPLEQITMVDRNVLRIGLSELLYSKKDEVPPKVAINEAIELAKSFGGESSGRFVNGVLGTVYKEIEKIEKEEIAKHKDEAPVELLSGGVVFRKYEGVFQIALLKDAFDRWTLPKGHTETDETAEQTALREIKEELGLKDLKVIKKLGEREYIAHEPEKGVIRRKVMDFLFEALPENELKIEDSDGIKEVKWFNLDEISGLKQYQQVKPVIKSVIAFLKQI